MMDRRTCRKFIAMIQAKGGRFVVEDGKWIGFELPEELMHMKDEVIDNAGILWNILCPPVKRSSRPRRHCQICRSGSGCRRRAAILEPRAVCVECGHTCRCHYPATSHWLVDIDRLYYCPPGCNLCDCPGWPEELPKSKRSKKENNMGFLIPDEILEASRVKYETTHPRPKSRAEILIEIVSGEPGEYTVRELAEAAERSPSWVRRTLRTAGLSDGVKSRKRGTNQVTTEEQSIITNTENTQ